MTGAAWLAPEDLAEDAGGEQGLPDHETEMRAAHGCVPSPAAAVKRGVTPSSSGMDGPQGGPIGGGP